MALAGAERIFELLDEKPETDEGYVTLVNVKEENGDELKETDAENRNDGHGSIFIRIPEKQTMLN